MPNETGDINKSESNFWRQDETGAAHLMAAFDLRSGNYHFPIPPSSLANLLKLEERELQTNGILYSYTVLHPHKKKFKAAIYAGLCRFSGRRKADGTAAGS